MSRPDAAVNRGRRAVVRWPSLIYDCGWASRNFAMMDKDHADITSVSRLHYSRRSHAIRRVAKVDVLDDTIDRSGAVGILQEMARPVGLEPATLGLEGPPFQGPARGRVSGPRDRPSARRRQSP